MALDYSSIKYLETVGDSVRIHFTDGKKLEAYNTGNGLFLPRKAGDAPPPPPYDPWEPPEEPTDPPPPGSWVHPLAGATLTSGYGYRSGGMHWGIDLSTTTAVSGGPVRSVAPMVITVAVDAFEGGNSTAGTYVKGHTADGQWTFTYNHGADESLQVSAGQSVAAGTVLFTEGQTGNVTGTHLHFEIIEGNWPDPWAPPYNNGAQFIDPLPVLRSYGVNI